MKKAKRICPRCKCPILPSEPFHGIRCPQRQKEAKSRFIGVTLRVMVSYLLDEEAQRGRTDN
jgi:hypothetical protein